MRVLMITARADHGGGPRHMELLLRDLPDWVVPYIACPEDDPYWSRFSELAGGRLFRIPHRQLSLSHASSLASYARRNDIQVIHAHGKGAGVYARIVSALTGIAGVHTAHGIHVCSYGSIARRLYVLYENITSHWIRHLIHVSPEEQNRARELGLWKTIPASVIANGVDSLDPITVQELRLASRDQLGIPDGLPVVATISRFDYQKNMCEAYSIAKAMPGNRFLWIGTGGNAPQLKADAASDGISNLHFLDRMDEPLKALAAADVYLSTSRWEGLPLAVLEAMSLGIPSVLSDVTGHHDLVECHGVGLLYPAGDIGSAVSAISRIADDDNALCRILSEQASAAQRSYFSSRAVAIQTASIYSSLVS